MEAGVRKMGSQEDGVRRWGQGQKMGSHLVLLHSLHCLNNSAYRCIVQPGLPSDFGQRIILPSFEQRE